LYIFEVPEYQIKVRLTAVIGNELPQRSRIINSTPGDNIH
jgi:hypothetical protein